MATPLTRLDSKLHHAYSACALRGNQYNFLKCERSSVMETELIYIMYIMYTTRSLSRLTVQLVALH